MKAIVAVPFVLGDMPSILLAGVVDVDNVEAYRMRYLMMGGNDD